jgi:MFS family permease
MTGLVCMAQGVSLGRFVFTPMLPLMLNDRSVTLVQGGALATSNYVGYLAGAILCLCIKPDPARMVRVGLVMAIVLTLAMALPGGLYLWSAWRALAGVSCAFVMIYGTAWSQQRLAELGRPTLAGMMFCGPGIGIVLTSLPAFWMVKASWPSSWGWLAFSLFGIILTIPVWRILKSSPSPSSAGAQSAAADRPSTETLRLYMKTCAITIIFGLAGFGYIIVATFLPVIARHAIPDSGWADLFWPIFGIGVAIGAWLVTRVGVHNDNRRLLMYLYIVQAVGVVIGAVWPTVTGFILCSLMVGTPFLAITSLAMREARRLWATKATTLIGLMTASYATGQVAGPILATTLVSRTGGFGTSLSIAAGALAIGAVGCFALLVVDPSATTHTSEPHTEQ